MLSELATSRALFIGDRDWLTSPMDIVKGLAEELLGTGDPWVVNGARVGRYADDEPTCERALDLSIAVDSGCCWGEISIPHGRSAQVRQSVDLVRRVGYSIAPSGGLGRRQLRGSRELEAEIRWFDQLRHDPATLGSRRPRVLRPIQKPPPARFVQCALTRLGGMVEGWSFRWVGAERRAPIGFIAAPLWGAVASCHAIVEEDVSWLEAGVQVCVKDDRVRPSRRETAGMRRALREQLEPFGYRPIRGVVWFEHPPPVPFMVNKVVRTLAAARRERKRIDRLIFADRRASPTR